MNHSIQHPKGQSDFFSGENIRRRWGLKIPDVPAADDLNPDQSWLLSIYLGRQGEPSDIFNTIRELWDCFEIPGKLKKKVDEKASKHIENGIFKKCACQSAGMRWVKYNANTHEIEGDGCDSRPLNYSEVLSLAIFSKYLFHDVQDDWTKKMEEFLKSSVISIKKEKKNITLSVELA